ncbi:MAG: L,D-transpeptidase family protein [Salinibacter sp.]
MAASSTPKGAAEYGASSTDPDMAWRSDPLFYVAGDAAVLYNRSDSTAPVARLSVRTPVRRLKCEDKWCRVRTGEGREGFMPASALSNAWVRVSKEKRRVYLYRGAKLIKTFEADLGYNAFADKKRRGGPRKRDHWRTPEGTFHVVHKNSESRFYKALVLNYPTVKDARRGLKKGLISQSQYEAIEQAQEEFRIPPMNTDLGGWIEIHGDGTGDATTWTHGCVAVQNRDMDVLWSVVEEGTPVLIE